jgi:microcystin-dependent protein
MTNINDGLVLHLKLNEVINNNTVVDSSKTKPHGTVHGTTLVPDETFRNCLSFNGEVNNYVTVPVKDALKISGNITISAWFYIEENFDKELVKILDIVNSTEIAGGLYQYGLFYSYNQRLIFKHSFTIPPYGNFTFCGQREELLQPATWYHFVCVFDAESLDPTGSNLEEVFKFYLNLDYNRNKQALMGKVPNPQDFQGLLNLRIGADTTKADLFDQSVFCSPYKGKISNIRIYNRALSLDEIKVVKEADEHPTVPVTTSSYRKEHPIAFSLFDEDKNYVLYISDDPTEKHTLNIELTNSSTQAIQFLNGREQVASDKNYHFELVFRLGTLSKTTIDLLNNDKTKTTILKDPNQWDVAISQLNSTKQTVSLYFLYKGTNITFAPAQHRVIALQNMSAAAGSGARGTQVELKLNQLAYVDELTKKITGSRVQKLHITNHTGQKNIPLHIGFVGSNRILNDNNSASTLKLRITNTSKEAISLKGGRFILSFDVGSIAEEWAIATDTQIKGATIKAKYPNNQEQDIQQAAGGVGQSPEWIIEKETLAIETLESKQYIDITISNIVTGHLSGNTNLYIKYENIPGYWDGQFICAIEKAPLLFYRNVDVDNVGIGITNPSAKLHVQGGDIKIGSDDKGIEFSGGAKIYKKSGSGLKFKPNNDSDGIEFTKIDGTSIMFLNNDGVSVNGDYYGKGHIWLHAFEGNGKTGTAYIQARDKSNGSGSSDIALQLRTQLRIQTGSTISKEIIEAMRLTPDGKVGIGTIYPSALLHVNGRIKDKTGWVMPVGSILPYAGSTAPDGWFLCDGSSKDKSTYGDLFAVISYTYGGSGNSFQIPNLRGRVPAGLSSETEFDRLNKAGGFKTHTLSISEMPSHNHGVTDPGHSHRIRLDDTTGHGYFDDSGNDFESHTYTESATTGISINNTGGGQPHNNLQPYITVNYIIKY